VPEDASAAINLSEAWKNVSYNIWNSGETAAWVQGASICYFDAPPAGVFPNLGLGRRFWYIPGGVLNADEFAIFTLENACEEADALVFDGRTLLRFPRGSTFDGDLGFWVVHGDGYRLEFDASSGIWYYRRDEDGTRVERRTLSAVVDDLSALCWLVPYFSLVSDCFDTCGCFPQDYREGYGCADFLCRLPNSDGNDFADVPILAACVGAIDSHFPRKAMVDDMQED
jgi:hypothetical protein